MATYNDVLSIISANLADGTGITADLHRAVEEALLDFANSQWLTGDIKEIDCTDDYITANFDGTGLGINEREGWAICNGQNETRNRNGRVSVAYGTSFPSVGDTVNDPVLGGSKDAVVVSHTHYVAVSGSQTNGNAGSLYDGSDANRFERGLSTRAFDASGDVFDYELVSVAGQPNAGKTSNATGSNGVSGTDQNMQPYIVTLFIQKL